MPTKPNILFLFSDQQHWQAVGFEDATFRTPHLDRLAARGTVFTHAFCTTPQCSPSRSSILTGLYPTATGVLGNVGAAGGDPLRMATIAPALQAAGYRTAYFGKWHLGKEPVATAGWDEEFGVVTKETTDDAETTRRALDFLARSAEGDRPFALFLSYNNPHDIYRFRGEEYDSDAPAELPDSWHRKDLSTVPAVQKQFMTEDQGTPMGREDLAQWRHYRDVYRRKVALYDDGVGLVLDTLEQRGLAKSTLVVATSDHGDMDGQHGLVFKGPFMYEHMMRVPLIVRLPGGARPAATVDFHTVNVDLAPTLADFAGAALPPGHGVSLRPLLAGQGPVPRRDFVVGQYYSKQQWVNPIRMIRTERAKYTLYRVHGEELYDLQADPDEIHNLAADPRCGQTRTQLAAQLEQWIAEHDDPFHTQHPTTRNGEPLSGVR